MLPSGWYPHSAQGVKDFLQDFSLSSASQARAVLSPHAGWFFSGRLAAQAIASLHSDIDTIVVAGGHLPPHASVLFAEEDEIETPMGALKIDTELRALLKKELDGKADSAADNTVEVLLPVVHYFFPTARLIWMRLPACMRAFEAGKIIGEKAAALQRRVAVIASTDLTHYGRCYDFTPKGFGAAALQWVKEVNDKRFIKALESGDPEEVLKRALHENSACSPGAVLCALGFSPGAARLLAYTTSADIMRATGEKGAPDSFVGYAAAMGQEDCPKHQTLNDIK
jgi:AmmeMemoRadiSam system protein B